MTNDLHGLRNKFEMYQDVNILFRTREESACRRTKWRERKSKKWRLQWLDESKSRCFTCQFQLAARTSFNFAFEKPVKMRKKNALALRKAGLIAK